MHDVSSDTTDQHRDVMRNTTEHLERLSTITATAAATTAATIITTEKTAGHESTR